MPVKESFKGGLEINFFPQRDFESLEGIEPSKQAPIIARNALRFLMMGWTQSWTDFLHSKVVKATLLKRDHELLRELRFAFQQGFYHVFEQLRATNNLTNEQKEQIHLYLSNCLTLLPYSDLTPYESINLPQYIDGKWEMVEYQITPIELTDNSDWSKTYLQDHDRVFAYGLDPIFQKKAESHLIFMGTTYPAGQGFLTQVNTDAKGFESVGETLYRTGRERIQNWLSQQQMTHICGVSLGGSLSLLLAIDQGDYKLSRVDALNPAGLHDHWTKSKFDHWDTLIQKPQVIVQKQGDDPVSAFGIWKNDWEILEVNPPKDKKGPNPFYDHFLNYAGFADTQFSYVDPSHDNEKRKTRNFWLYSIGRSLIYYGFLLPFTHVIRPLLLTVAHHSVVSVLMLGIIFTAGLALAGVLSGSAFLLIAGGLLAGGVILSEFSNVHHIKTRKPGFVHAEESTKDQLANLHHPSLMRNPTMDIYNKENQVEIDLSYQELQTYYKVMRCIVKDKNYLPMDDKASKHVGGITKKELLERTLNSQDADLIVPFKVTKAKAAHIKHTLTLVHKIGIENEEKLKPALEQCYLEYRLGKNN